MKKFVKLLVILLTLSCFSCKEEHTQSDPFVGEGICDYRNGEKKTSNLEGYEGFFEIYEDLFVNKLPGIYDKEFELEFKLRSETATLKYRLNSGKEEGDFIDYKSPIKIKILNKKDIKDYPLTTSVDADLYEYDTLLVYSDDYVNNVQRKNSYHVVNKQNFIEIQYRDPAKERVFNTNLTYLINSDIDLKNITVVSLTAPYSSWFGGDKPFYNSVFEDESIRVNLEYFCYNEDEYFARNSSAKIGGNNSRGFPQRSINLNFKKDENGNKNQKVTADIFRGATKECNHDKKLNKFTRFKLHNGGNDFEKYTGINDAITQTIANGTKAATSSYRPCIAYLNGEYWGLYSIREHYTDTYIEDNFDVDKEDVAIAYIFSTYRFDDGNQAGFSSDIKELKNAYNCDLTIDSNYRNLIDNYIDEESFIDFIIVRSFASDIDFIGNFNNVKLWHTVKKDPDRPYYDRKWRFIQHDCDYGFIGDITNYLDPSVNYSYMLFPLVKNLFENHEFREKFYNRAVELTKERLNSEYLIKTIDGMINEIKDYREESYLRYGKPSAYMTTWKSKVENCKTFARWQSANYLINLKKILDTYKN